MRKILFLFLFFGGSWGNTASNQKITITGSSTIAPLMAEIAKAFEAKNPTVRVDVQTGGSSRGITDARDGTADIGMVSRSLKATESDLKAFTIALDGICIIVHKSNPIETLSRQQIVDIYTGQITNWKAVGGKDAPITVVNKAEGRSTLELFLHHFNLKNTDIKAHVIIGDNEQGIKTVAGNKNAVGYVSVGTAEFDASHGVAIKLLKFDGVIPSVENIKKGVFPITRQLNLVTKTEPSGTIKNLIEFAKSPEVKKIVEKQYFVPILK